ncbi:Acg family FMN-binding oxidoreductase [Streptomyces sp. NBC_01013]|uniref:Acg family FMN-binding oxidoreductase n=1 Tax=Streptomyces sp. NBC_01013 TaxID=2903718 RepID=UPI003868A6FA|nr:nitroreductase [Streptomyces sp. NBC_01013]
MLTTSPSDTTVTALVADTTAAPSLHNAQPWQFRYDRSAHIITLRADFARTMTEADPSTRELHVGCGAALLNLRVSAAHYGLAAVTALLPAPADQALLAEARLEPLAGSANLPVTELYPAIRDRHTCRFPFAERPIPPELRSLFSDAAHAEHADFRFVDSLHLDTVLRLISDAANCDRMDPARDAEQRFWTRHTKTDAPVDGVPDYAFGPGDASDGSTTRDYAGTTPLPGRVRVRFERRPQLGLLSTEGDRPLDWLRAGQALERVLLSATSKGVSASFATQPLEWPDLRWTLRDPVLGTGHPQMIVRMGYGPVGPHTPRRPLRQVLVIEP